MHLIDIGGLVLIWLSLISRIVSNESVAASRGLLIYRTISVIQRSCNCSVSFSCSCCQNVIILYTGREKNLCVNFTYQRNGLNVDVALSSDTISTRTVTNYKAFQFCVYVPGSLFSNACVNILELNRFPRSITICLRLDIYTKEQLWQINYNCMSVLTELPLMLMTGSTKMMGIKSEGMSIAGIEQTRRSPITESVMEMASTETMMVQTPELNSSLTIGMMVQTNTTDEAIVD